MEYKHDTFQLEEKDLFSDVNPKKRVFTDDQIGRFESYAAEILASLGMDLNTPATNETPRRFIQAMIEATEGYDGDPKLLKIFQTECFSDSDCHVSQVVEGPVQFFSLCEHHALPFYGHAYVGYIAQDNIIGISKLTRLVRIYAKRFAVQERIGQQIADTLEVMLHPLGVAVYLEAHHLCVEMRGVREQSPKTRTTVWRGLYAAENSLRAEFFAASGLQR